MMTLREGVTRLGLSLSLGQEEALEKFLSLLTKWNDTYNLTAITDRERMVTHHLLDSLAVLPHLAGLCSLADVGSGAGLPGIPLAVCRPELKIASIEANQKKATFQRQAKIELNLPNVSIYSQRVEDCVGTYDGVVSRAFSSMGDFARQAGHLSCRLFAMKGVYPESELASLPAAWRVVNSIRLSIPGLDAERHLIVLGRD